MAVHQKDIARTLRPYTLHAQQVMAQARASVERVPAVLTLVQRALEGAGLQESVGMALHLDTESAIRGAKAFPEGSAQHEALWALVMAARAGQEPLEAGRYLQGCLPGHRRRQDGRPIARFRRCVAQNDPMVYEDEYDVDKLPAGAQRERGAHAR